MRKKVTEFPPRLRAEEETPIAQRSGRIIFEIADQRLVFNYTITELNPEPAKVISMTKKRRRKKGPH